MKPSGIEWIGDIPDDWEVRRLKGLGEQTIGLTYSPQDITDNSGTLVLRSSNIQNGKLVLDRDDNVYVSIDVENKILKDEDILICSRNGSRNLVGKTAFVITYGKKLSYGAFTTIFRSKYNKFLFYVFNAGVFEYHLASYNTSTINQLTTSMLNEIRVPFPPVKTQQKIADYLDEKCGEIDATIAKQKESIEKLKAYKQSLISETVTKGLDKSAPLKPSGIDYLGDIPSHWEIRKLKYVANFNQNTLPEDTDGQFELKYIDIGNVSSVDGIKEIQYFNFSNAPSRARRIVKYGDIIVSTVRTYLRAITSIKEDYDNCICSTGFAVITPKDNFQQDFVVYAIENESFIAQIIANSQGISYPAINVSQLENLKLAFPSVKEQKEIVDFLKTKLLEIDSIINKKQNIMQKLDTYKKSLIFEYVTGKKYV